MSNIVGIDIGYSNLKLAFGKAKDAKCTTLIRPAGAAPADRFSDRADGNAHSDYLHVLVDGEPFIAGVSNDKAAMWSRSLHADYPASPSYKALFHAGLLLSEFDTIHTLVTGLPVSQYLDEAKREALAKQMTGKHQVTPKRAITVERVKVVPQPVGGFLDFADQSGEDFDDMHVLVVDPGFFSVDWVVIADNILERASSDTSLEASSVVLDEAAKLIGKDYGVKLGEEHLEGALRAGKPTVTVLGKKVEIEPYINSAADKVAPVVVESIQKSLRKLNKPVDKVLMVGGGAGFFAPAVAAVFHNIDVVSASESALANARGFWHMGASL